MAQKTYNTNYTSPGLASGNTQAINFQINSPNRQISVNSIIYQLKLSDAGGIPINNYTQVGCVQELILGGGGIKICSSPEVLIGLQTTGELIKIFFPGQYFYENLIFFNTVPFTQIVTNRFAANLNYIVNITIDTTEEVRR